MVLRVLLLKEGSGTGWVAQCLEHDIAAQGGSIKEAVQNFQDVFQAQVALDIDRNREPLASKKQAPPWYWQALKDAEPLRDAIPLKVPKQSWFSFLSSSTSAQAWVH